MDYHDARDIALKYIIGIRPQGDRMLIDHDTQETKDGWVFFYNSKRYIETRNISFALLGNGPIHVAKRDGTLTKFGTALPWTHYLERVGDEELSSKSEKSGK